MNTKKTTKKATKKSPAKAASKKAPAKKATTKKAPAAKKTAAKKTVTKKTAAEKSATKKAPAKKKAETTKKATVKTTSEKAPAKKKKAAPTKKAETTKKAATEKKAPAKKKAATKKKSTKKTAEKPVRKKLANVGQAPRKTEFAASIPVPTQIVERDASQSEVQDVANREESAAAKSDFKVKDQIVYPAHGVGVITAVEKQSVAGITTELFVITFEQEKMKLRVPTSKAKIAGMRPLSDEKTIKDAMVLLKGRARIKRTMWSRRAQEYDAKINSGSLKLVSEVVRDLFRADDQPEQSYSERQLFEAALDRMAREVAASRKVDLGVAIGDIEDVLRKKASTTAAA